MYGIYRRAENIIETSETFTYTIGTGGQCGMYWIGPKTTGDHGCTYVMQKSDLPIWKGITPEEVLETLVIQQNDQLSKRVDS